MTRETKRKPLEMARTFTVDLVVRCLDTIDVCIWRMFVFMSVVVTVWGSVGMLVV